MNGNDRTQRDKRDLRGRRIGRLLPPLLDASWQPIDDLRREVDRLFDDFLAGRGRRHMPGRRAAQRAGTLPPLSPDAEFIERPEAYEICLELPGMAEQDIDIALADGHLRVLGEKRAEALAEGETRHLCERRFGAFARSFALPEGVEAAKARATYERGVLRILLPRNAQASGATRHIPIDSG